jgi:hypothetical protein
MGSASFSAGFPTIDWETKDCHAAGKYVFLCVSVFLPIELLDQSQFGFAMTQAVGDQPFPA